MYHDLCIPYTPSQADLQRSLSFLVELSYTVIAISLPLPSGTPQTKQSTSIPSLPESPPGLKPLLTRLTLPLLTPSDLPTSRLHTLQQTYDLVALRPTSEKTLLLATSTPDADLISLDLSCRWPFHFRPKMFSAAVKRGAYFEICYGAATNYHYQKAPSVRTGSSGGGRSGFAAAEFGDLIPATDAATARRNFITNATGLVRALRGGRNVVFSSDASSVLGLRAPMDVVNLGVLCGISAELGLEGVREAPALVVRAARARREGWRGVVLGVQISPPPQDRVVASVLGKRRAVEMDGAMENNAEKIGNDKSAEKALSKRQMKKLAKREKAERQGKTGDAIAATDTAAAVVVSETEDKT